MQNLDRMAFNALTFEHLKNPRANALYSEWRRNACIETRKRNKQKEGRFKVQ
jgi:hypothetical protein